MRRVPAAVLIGSMLALAASASMAIGFGRVGSTTVLGHPLEFTAALNMDADEWLGVECVAAEVTAGDTKFAPDTIRVRLDPPRGGSSTVHVSTTVRVDEPVVSVKLLLGCPVRLSREFVAFVDPPLIGLPQTAVAQTAPTPQAAPATPAEGASPSSSSSGVTAPEPTASPPAPAPRVAKRVQPRRSKRPTIVVAATPARSASTTAAPLPSSSEGTKAPVVARAPAAASGPRLMLDPAQALLKPAAPAASVAPTTLASASREPPAAPDATDAERAKERERVAGLENRIERMLKDSQAQQQAMTALQARLRETDSGRGGALLYGLLALVALLLLVIAALLWRQSRFKGHPAWWSSGPMDLDRGPTASELDRDPANDRTSSSVHAMPGRVPQPVVVEVPPSPPPQPAVRAEASAPEPTPTFPGLPLRDLTVEELIDLEQQADFFIVLGQEEAAIDLLMGHVRSSGGASPMPYLKLLDIYRRRGDRDAYARIRERFNRRFNAYAPEYESDPRDGRTLEGYAPVMARLQAVWPTPNKAMDLLQSLLFRRDSSDGTFDLPAYGELLFLYAHARDLAEHESSVDGVDLLLPLAKDSEDAMTRTIKLAPSPPAMTVEAPYPVIDPTAAVDLELDLRDPDTGVKV